MRGSRPCGFSAVNLSKRNTRQLPYPARLSNRPSVREFDIIIDNIVSVKPNVIVQRSAVNGQVIAYFPSEEIYISQWAADQ